MRRTDASGFFEEPPPGHDTGLPDDKVRVVLEEIKEMGYLLEVRGGTIYSRHPEHPGEEFSWPRFRCDHCFAQARRVLEEVFGETLN